MWFVWCQMLMSLLMMGWEWVEGDEFKMGCGGLGELEGMECWRVVYEGI